MYARVWTENANANAKILNVNIDGRDSGLGICQLRHWLTDVSKSNAGSVRAFIFRIKLIIKWRRGTGLRLQNSLLSRRYGVGAGPQLPSSLMGFDYQYMNKLAIYHAQATANWGEARKKKSKLKMKNDGRRNVCVCTLCLVGGARVNFFFFCYFPPRHISIQLVHSFALRRCATIFHLIAPIWMINDQNMCVLCVGRATRQPACPPDIVVKRETDTVDSVAWHFFPFPVIGITLIRHVRRWIYILIGCCRLSHSTFWILHNLTAHWTVECIHKFCLVDCILSAVCAEVDLLLISAVTLRTHGHILNWRHPPHSVSF